MKYINFKRYKFSTVLKKIDTIKHNFLGFFKYINVRRYNFKRILRYLNFKGYSFYLIAKNFLRYLNFKGYSFYLIAKKINFKKYTYQPIYFLFSVILVGLFKFINVRRYNFRRILRHLNFKGYSFNLIPKKINFKKYTYLPIYFLFSVILVGLVYLIIPTFYKYDKSNLEKSLCKNKNIECFIKGKVSYSFYPTPRIKIKNLVINDFFEKKNTLITTKDVAIKLSFKNLINKKRLIYKKINLNDFEINLDLKKLNRYKNVFKKNISFIPISFNKGQIIFLNEEKYIATINNANINLKFVNDILDSKLNGKFLDDDIHFSLKSKKIDAKLSTDIILKMSDLNFLVKANFFNSLQEKNTVNGNVLIKKGKNRFTGIFKYNDNKLVIEKSNLRNTFMDGKLEGLITYLPYFNFDLDLTLNSINFTKLYNHFLALDDESQRNLFKINKKINGKLNFSSDKVYSGYNLVKSFESRLKFNNGNILIDQFLVNLGKLGAADLLGTIDNDKKFTNLKFETNIFVDNQKKFLSKFGIYNKKNIASNLFVSGNFDLENIKTSLYEISDNEKFENEEIDYIEREFNDLVLEEGYKNLFSFPIFKEFLKSINDENN